MNSSKVNLESFITPISDAVTSVLLTMSQVELKQDSYKIIPSSELIASKGSLTGVVSIKAENLTGTLALNFDESLICKIYSNILSGESVPKVNDDVKDAAMEITNIVFGNAKRDINKLGFDIQPSLPNIIHGEQHKIHHSQKSQCLCIVFASNIGNLYVECSANL
jgi:chemotaxis protein CheX